MFYNIKTNNPKISVVMLTFNRERFIERAIKSILAQTFKEFELIIVDNGSTDSSGKIADKYVELDERVKVIHCEKSNIGRGRNIGLDKSIGDYIAFIDDDDYMESDFLEFLFKLVEIHNADISVCGSYKDENGVVTPNGFYVYEELYVMSAEQATEKFLRRQLYNCAMPTKLIRRELFDKIRFLETGNYDDISTTYKYFANANTVVAHGIPKYTFYRHQGNNSSDATKHHLLNPTQLNEYLMTFKDRTKYIEEKLPKLYALSRYSEWSYMISMIEKINKFNLINCNELLEFMKNEIRVNLDEFLNAGFIQDFEKEWIDKYIKI